MKITKQPKNKLNCCFDPSNGLECPKFILHHGKSISLNHLVVSFPKKGIFGPNRTTKNFKILFMPDYYSCRDLLRLFALLVLRQSPPLKKKLEHKWSKCYKRASSGWNSYKSMTLKVLEIPMVAGKSMTSPLSLIFLTIS